VHIGHLIIASHIANNTALEQVWFVVSPQNPLKGNNFLLNEHIRKHLIDLSIKGEKKLRTSDVEFQLSRPSYTVNTLNYLSKKYPGDEFSIIMGSDSFQNIKLWKNYKLLLKEYQTYVYERPGFKITRELKRNIILINDALLEISSTRVRELVQSGKSIRYLVPDIVKKEIDRKKYYK
jgi:nicotinate-nucleotide adenylyltransferase